MKIKQGVVTIEPITIIAAVIALILGAVIGFCYRKQIAEAKIGVAEKRANDIVEDAISASLSGSGVTGAVPVHSLMLVLQTGQSVLT